MAYPSGACPEEAHPRSKSRREKHEHRVISGLERGARTKLALNLPSSSQVASLEEGRPLDRRNQAHRSGSMRGNYGEELIRREGVKTMPRFGSAKKSVKGESK